MRRRIANLLLCTAVASAIACLVVYNEANAEPLAQQIKIPPPPQMTWAEFRDVPYKAAVVAEKADEPWTIGTLNTSYDYQGSLPIRRDLLLALKSGWMNSFYDALSYQFFVGGVKWQPLIGENRIGETGALFAGIKSRF